MRRSGGEGNGSDRLPGLEQLSAVRDDPLTGGERTANACARGRYSDECDGHHRQSIVIVETKHASFTGPAGNER